MKLVNNTRAAFTTALFVLFVQFVLSAPKATAADKLRIGYGAPSVAMSVLWITKEGKLFEKNGLDVLKNRDRVKFFTVSERLYVHTEGFGNV